MKVVANVLARVVFPTWRGPDRKAIWRQDAKWSRRMVAYNRGMDGLAFMDRRIVQGSRQGNTKIMPMLE